MTHEQQDTTKCQCDCGDKSQCWEPCGDLGKDAEFARSSGLDADICDKCGRGGSERMDGYEAAKDECRPQIIAAEDAIAELARYFTSGNCIPVDRAVIRAEDFWRIVGKAGFESPQANEGDR